MNLLKHAVASVLVLAVGSAAALDAPVRGQLLYVPVYSEVPFGNKGFTLKLTATLSVRNLDQRQSIRLNRVDYYSATGARIRAYLEQPLTLKPLSSVEFILRESDVSGGISASFLVDWSAGQPTRRPNRSSTPVT